jgi:hypothetical protein
MDFYHTELLCIRKCLLSKELIITNRYIFFKFQLALQDHNYVSKIPPTPSPPPPPPLPVLQPPTVLQVTQDGRKRLQSGGVVVPAAGPAAPGQPGSNAALTAQSAVQAAAAANLPMHPNPSFNSNPNLRGLIPELPLPSRSTSATTAASTAASLSPAAAASSATPGPGGRLVLQQPQQQPQQPQQPPQKPAQTATSSPAGLLNAVTGQPGKIPIWNTILLA